MEKGPEIDRAIDTIIEMKELFDDLKQRRNYSRKRTITPREEKSVVKKGASIGANWISTQLFRWLRDLNGYEKVDDIIEDFDNGLQSILSNKDSSFVDEDHGKINTYYYLEYNNALARFIRRARGDSRTRVVSEGNRDRLRTFLSSNPDVVQYINDNRAKLEGVNIEFKKYLVAEQKKREEISEEKKRNPPEVKAQTQAVEISDITYGALTNSIRENKETTTYDKKKLLGDMEKIFQNPEIVREITNGNLEHLEKIGIKAEDPPGLQEKFINVLKRKQAQNDVESALKNINSFEELSNYVSEHHESLHRELQNVNKNIEPIIFEIIKRNVNETSSGNDKGILGVMSTLMKNSIPFNEYTKKPEFREVLFANKMFELAVKKAQEQLNPSIKESALKVEQGTIQPPQIPSLPSTDSPNVTPTNITKKPSEFRTGTDPRGKSRGPRSLSSVSTSIPGGLRPPGVMTSFNTRKKDPSQKHVDDKAANEKLLTEHDKGKTNKPE